MLLTEVNVFGVYVSPWALALLVAWASVFTLRVVLTRLDALRYAWHPALLMLSAFVGLFSLTALLAMGLS